MSFAKKSQKKNVGTLEASSELLGCGADLVFAPHRSVEGRHTTFAKPECGYGVGKRRRKSEKFF